MRVASARPKALPMANGQTIGKLPLAAATRFICHFSVVRPPRLAARQLQGA
jgi:hypothetical protein